MAKAKKDGAKAENSKLTAYLEDIKFGSLSLDDIVQGSSRNLEAIADANRAVIEGYSDLAKRQYEMLKEFIDQLKDLADDDAELSDKFKSVLDTAKKDMQDLQKMASDTNSQAQEILKKRTNENIDAWKELMEETRTRLTRKDTEEEAAPKKKAARKKAAAKRYTKSVNAK